MPSCGGELSGVCGENYCYKCARWISEEDVVYSKNISFDDDYDFEEPEYDSPIDNGDSICLNCTY